MSRTEYREKREAQGRGRDTGLAFRHTGTPLNLRLRQAPLGSVTSAACQNELEWLVQEAPDAGLTRS